MADDGKNSFCAESMQRTRRIRHVLKHNGIQNDPPPKQQQKIMESKIYLFSYLDTPLDVNDLTLLILYGILPRHPPTIGKGGLNITGLDTVKGNGLQWPEPSTTENTSYPRSAEVASCFIVICHGCPWHQKQCSHSLIHQICTENLPAYVQALG